jgi:hypothetical protein
MIEVATDPAPKDVESKFRPFTMLGLLLGSVGVVAKLVTKLAGAMRP